VFVCVCAASTLLAGSFSRLLLSPVVPYALQPPPRRPFSATLRSVCCGVFGAEDKTNMISKSEAGSRKLLQQQDASLDFTTRRLHFDRAISSEQEAELHLIFLYIYKPSCPNPV